MRPARLSLAALPFVALVSLAAHLAAQDTRTVTEPKTPPACVTLEADIVSNHGNIALSDEQKLSTARIQDAMDHCAQGEAVVLRAHGKKNVLLTGPLTLRPGVTLVVDKNTSLVASRDPRVYDTTPGGCGIVSMHGGRACKPLISADGAKDSGIMGEGSVDARGGATLLGQDVTWWDLAHEAKVKDESQSVFAMIALRHVDGFILYKITLRNSPGFHVSINQTDGFTAWGVKIMTPKTARNTDGIDPGSSKNITIAYSYIHTGDDDVCLKPSGMGGVSNMSVLHNHFYSGHGMSIGSGTFGGVDHLLVDDLTIDGADNGIRIKSDRSRGGLVHQVVYRNVCIRNVPNPLVFTPHYTTFTGNRLPIYNDITLENVHILTPGAYTFFGLDADPGHKLEIKLDNVFADDQKDSLFYNQDASITIGPHLGNLVPKGDDVTDTNAPDSAPGQPLDCDARFVPFPEDKTAPEMAGKIPPEDKTFYVAADGTGDYYSIQRALDMAPKTGGAVLSVSPGVYREVLTVDKPDITIRSANPDASKTVIVNDRNAGQNGGTLHSATVNVTADDFFAENITIENDFNRTHEQTSQARRPSPFSLQATAPSSTTYVSLAIRTPSISAPIADQTPRIAPSRASTSPIATLPATLTSSSVTVKPSSRTAKFTPPRTAAATSPRSPGTIPSKTPALCSTTAGSLPIPASQAPSSSAARGVPMPPSFICIPRWTTRSIPQDGANGIPAKATRSKRSTTRNSTPPAPARITTSAIRTRISSRPTRPSNTSRQSSSAAPTTGIRPSSPLRPRSKIEL